MPRDGVLAAFQVQAGQPGNPPKSLSRAHLEALAKLALGPDASDKRREGLLRVLSDFVDHSTGHVDYERLVDWVFVSEGAAGGAAPPAAAAAAAVPVLHPQAAVLPHAVSGAGAVLRAPPRSSPPPVRPELAAAPDRGALSGGVPSAASAGGPGTAPRPSPEASTGERPWLSVLAAAAAEQAARAELAESAERSAAERAAEDCARQLHAAQQEAAEEAAAARRQAEERLRVFEVAERAEMQRRVEEVVQRLHHAEEEAALRGPPPQDSDNRLAAEAREAEERLRVFEVAERAEMQRRVEEMMQRSLRESEEEAALRGLPPPDSDNMSAAEALQAEERLRAFEVAERAEMQRRVEEMMQRSLRESEEEAALRGLPPPDSDNMSAAEALQAEERLRAFEVAERAEMQRRVEEVIQRLHESEESSQASLQAAAARSEAAEASQSELRELLAASRARLEALEEEQNEMSRLRDGRANVAASELQEQQCVMLAVAAKAAERTTEPRADDWELEDEEAAASRSPPPLDVEDNTPAAGADEAKAPTAEPTAQTEKSDEPTFQSPELPSMEKAAAEDVASGEASTAASARASGADLADVASLPPAPPARSFRIGDRIRLRGLQANPWLNGTAGTLECCDDEYWHVRLDTGNEWSVRPKFLELMDPETAYPPSPPLSMSMSEQTASELGRSPPSVPAGVLGRAAAAAAAMGDFQAGQYVRIVGLTTRQDLNGAEGCLELFNEARGVWNVSVSDSSGTIFAVRPENLLELLPPLSGDSSSSRSAPPPAFVPAEAATGAPEPEETIAAGAEPAPQREASPHCGFLTVGARVRITNLRGDVQFNAAEGILLRWDGDRGVWHVDLSGGGHAERVVALKPDKLELIESADSQPLEPPVTKSETLDSETVLRGALSDVNESVAMDAASCASAAAAASNGVPPSPSGPSPRGEIQAPVRRDEGLRPGDRICLRNLQDHPQLNGIQGVLEQWHEERGCWTVHLDSGSVHSLRPENVVAVPQTLLLAPVAVADAPPPPEGTLQLQPPTSAVPPPSGQAWEPQAGVAARLQNLSNFPDLNGQEVVIQQYVPEGQCWAVELPSGEKRAVRTENLAPSNAIAASAPEQVAGLVGNCSEVVPQPTPPSGAQPLQTRSDTSSTSATLASVAAQPPLLTAGSGACSCSPGQEVEIVGLMQHPQFNGRLATILDILEGGDCLQVVVEEPLAEGDELHGATPPRQVVVIKRANARLL
eukprot:TRINITY_DN8089_c0_g1_i1.p1 TRINITY_DN8089_c0_g1~~TRINITY_DN8089_c0_g1_i1.p1  ORF type:complete len:1231 (-),score=337.84 TRINITY_DN8089_c0_g1_i1:171-3863(-)